MGLVVVVMVMMVCAEALQVKKAELGQNVTLTCSGNTSYWSMEIHSQLICCIAHILKASEASFSFPSFRSKFSLLRNSLTISRKNQGRLVHIDTFQLVSGVIGSWLRLKNRLWVNVRSPVAHTPETPQYEEIPFYLSSVLPPAAPECVYYKAQLPAPH